MFKSFAVNNKRSVKLQDWHIQQQAATKCTKSIECHVYFVITLDLLKIDDMHFAQKPQQQKYTCATDVDIIAIAIHTADDIDLSLKFPFFNFQNTHTRVSGGGNSKMVIKILWLISIYMII